MTSTQEEIAITAARMVVEEGLEYGAAKRRACKQLGLPSRTALPDNAALESAVLEYIALFCADTQPAELRALRELALEWLQRLAAFRPHVGGAVWSGAATRHSDIYIQLFCDDPKAAEIELVNLGVAFSVASVTGLHGEAVDALSMNVRCLPLQSYVGIHLLVYDFDDLRGALLRDKNGRSARGDAASLRQLLSDSAT